jgi:hypothetical protein
LVPEAVTLKVAVPPVQTATFWGCAEMDGPELSVTLTLNVHVWVLPDASVAVQVTVVVPAGNVVPEAGLQLAVAPGQLSVGVGVV